MAFFSTHLIALRKEKGFTQTQLGDAVGVSRYTVSAWERGTQSPSLEELERIAGIFNVSVVLLISDDAKEAADAPATENKAAPAGEGGGEAVMPKEVGTREGVCVLSVFKREEQEKLSALCDDYSRLDEIDRAEIRGEINSLIKVALKNAKYAPQKDAKLA